MGTNMGLMSHSAAIAQTSQQSLRVQNLSSMKLNESQAETANSNYMANRFDLASESPDIIH